MQITLIRFWDLNSPNCQAMEALTTFDDYKEGYRRVFANYPNCQTHGSTGFTTDYSNCDKELDKITANFGITAIIPDMVVYRMDIDPLYARGTNEPTDPMERRALLDLWQAFYKKV